jgi:hypothetical protein
MRGINRSDVYMSTMWLIILSVFLIISLLLLFGVLDDDEGSDSECLMMTTAK